MKLEPVCLILNTSLSEQKHSRAKSRQLRRLNIHVKGLFSTELASEVKFRRHTSHEPNRMLMRENKGFFSFAFDSAHVKYGVWTWPELVENVVERRAVARQSLWLRLCPWKTYDWGNQSMIEFSSSVLMVLMTNINNCRKKWRRQVPRLACY